MGYNDVSNNVPVAIDKMNLIPLKSNDLKKSPSMPSFPKFENYVKDRSTLSNRSSIQLHDNRDTFTISDSPQGPHVETMSIEDSFVNLYIDTNEESSTRPIHDRTSSFQSTTLKRRSDVTDPQHFDRYGFKKKTQFITEEEYDRWWAEYSKYCVKRKHKWRKFLLKSGLSLNNDLPEKFPPQSEKLKRYIRKGIPAEWRGNAWWYYARGDEMLNKNKGLYSRLLKKVEENKNNKNMIQDIDVIERDLNRTFPDNIHFHRESFQKEEPFMIQALRRVLLAFSIYDTEIGYCQSMNFLAALLLLFLSEEKAFWMLVIITRKYLPGVHSVNLEGVNVDQGVLVLCIKEYLPELWSKMEASMLNATGQKSMTQFEILNKLPPITLSTASWFMSCFVGVVPIETTLRIWDCLFYEKSHFLFKVSLAILKLSEDELLERKLSISQSILATFSTESLEHTNNNRNNVGTNYRSRPRVEDMSQDDYDMLLFQVIQTFPKKILNPNDIFEKVIFKKKVALNKLDQDEIDKIRKYVSSQRDKWSKFNKVLNKESGNKILYDSIDDTTSTQGEAENMNLSNEEIMDTLTSEMSSFKRISLSGVSWNNSIKARVKNIRQRK